MQTQLRAPQPAVLEMVEVRQRTDATAAPPDLRQFCAEHYSRVENALAFYTGDQLVAQELAQEAFVRLCREWPNLSESRNRVGWVHTVAFNLAKSRFRRRAAGRRAQQKAANTARATISSKQAMPDTADVLAVRNAVASLPDKERAVIVLRYYSDLSIAETATSLKIPEGTVKTRTRRGLELLRASGLTLSETADESDALDPMEQNS